MQKETKMGFTNIYGQSYDNIREIAYKNKLTGEMYNFGEYMAETKHTDNGFNAPREIDGVYIFRQFDNPNIAYRIYKEWADYEYNGNLDDRLISKLQEIQKDIKLTEFPTGVVTKDGYIIGQEIPYYDGITLKQYLDSLNEEDIVLTNEKYLEVLKILKELLSQGMLYQDNHFKNFMVTNDPKKIRLIDFDYGMISFGSNLLNKNRLWSLTNSIITQNKTIFKNNLYNLDNCCSFDDIEYIIEDYCEKIK